VNASSTRAIVGRAARATRARLLWVATAALGACVLALGSTSASAARFRGSEATPHVAAASLGARESAWASGVVSRSRDRVSRLARRGWLHGGNSALPALSSSVATGTLSGTVISSVSKTSLAGVEVCAFEAGSPSLGETEEEEPSFECTRTGSGGEYTLTNLPAGEYLVEFFAPPTVGDYQIQYYKERERVSEADIVTVSGGGELKEIDAALLPGGAIAGRVTSAATLASLGDVLVCAFDEAVESGECTVTKANGEYTITGLATGDYEVVFVPDGEEGETTYELQYYDDVTSTGLATAVKVAAGATTSPIDDALRLTVPLLRSSPSVLGSTVVGQTLTVAHGSWTNDPTSFVDKWLRCAMPTSERCLILATGGSYTLQPGDVGSVIVADETAVGASGESEPVWSPASAVVTAAPAAAAPTPSAPAAASTPALGSLASKSALASVAQLRALLAGLLVPGGEDARIGQLLKRRGYSVSFAMPSAGKLTISWYLVPAGAHLARAKAVLAASGSVSTSGAGRSKLTIRLTARGRLLLAHASHLKLTARGVLTGTGHAALAAVRTFTLKR
jgi:hypothetical protein